MMLSLGSINLVLMILINTIVIHGSLSKSPSMTLINCDSV